MPEQIPLQLENDLNDSANWSEINRTTESTNKVPPDAVTSRSSPRCELESFASEVSAALQKLREKDVRIILGNFNETWARRIFCEAYRENMYGRKYQWIIMGTYSEEWWAHEDEDANCSTAHVAAALEGCILTDLLPLSTNGEITVSGITAEEYRLEYDSRRGAEYSRFHGYTYDGVWAVALAIQHVAHRIRHFRKNQTVVDFRYRDPLWERLFLEALKNTSFEGVTGPVRFYDNEHGSEVKVGEFNGVTEQLDLTRGHAIQWPHGRHPPKDRTLKPSPSSEDILIVPKNEHCQSKRMTIFVSSIYAYKGLLMIFGAFLAWETRHVSIPALNDSKYVGMSVYNVVIMHIVSCICSQGRKQHFLQNHHQ
ncbi:Metabotropic GABA-B receptor subtype 2 [Gryllus bimaculatus]|nr:Metabotropic GABA-B receptor subtype 2 [Gryllus bimaculatus]